MLIDKCNWRCVSPWGLALTGLLSAQPLWAQSPEATAELVPADTPVEIETITFEKDARSGNAESTTQILQNLENLVHDNSQSEEIINQYDDVVSKARGFIGQVSSLKDDSFKISLPGGEELLIAPDKSTTLVKNGETVQGNEAQLSEWLEIDDWLVLIGIQNGEIFQPRRIMISSESLEPSDNFVYRGEVRSATSSKVDVEILGEEELTETFALTKSTNLVDQDNETITTRDLQPGMTVLLIGENKGAARSLQTLRLI